jgi:DNA-binding SARP family transcriptional activator
MREFRILGPVEVLLDGRVVPLGGQRQRSLLAVLLVHHGQVVPLDRLVDLLWGDRAPKTATTSLQNGISQLRRELGADVVETRAPGYIVDVDPATVDSVRFESMLAASRAAPAAERAELLRSALALWRGPPLADLAAEEWAQGEIRRLEDLRLTALEERIDADIELGLHREVVGELEALSAANPLRERVCALRMLALYRSGRQAEALQAFRDTRLAYSEQLGIEPGVELQELHTQILRQDSGLVAPGAGAAAGDVEGEVLRAVLGGRVVPVLGLVGGVELARHLAERFEVPGNVTGPLGRVTQYVAAMHGVGPLHDELHAFCGRSEEPGPVHHLLARFPPLLRERGAPYQLLVTTAFDDCIERAFAEADEELDVVTYIAGGPLQGRFVHSPPGAEPRMVDVPNAYADLSLDERTVLLRLRGAADPRPERAWESLVVTEDDHIDYPGASELEGAIPVTLAARLRRSHFLFLGYDLADWNLRLVVNRLRGGRSAPYASWAVRAAPTALELAFWRHLDVHALDVDENAFAGLLDGRLDGLTAA